MSSRSGARFNRFAAERDHSEFDSSQFRSEFTSNFGDGDYGEGYEDDYDGDYRGEFDSGAVSGFRGSRRSFFDRPFEDRGFSDPVRERSPLRRPSSAPFREVDNFGFSESRGRFNRRGGHVFDSVSSGRGAGLGPSRLQGNVVISERPDFLGRIFADAGRGSDRGADPGPSRSFGAGGHVRDRLGYPVQQRGGPSLHYSGPPAERVPFSFIDEFGVRRFAVFTDDDRRTLDRGSSNEAGRGAGFGPSRSGEPGASEQVEDAFAEMNNLIRSGGEGPSWRVVSEWPEGQQEVSDGPLPSSARAAPALAPAAAVSAPSADSLLVPRQICQRLMKWITDGITTDASKATNKEFPLAFEEEDFSLKPPKLDGWVKRRASEKKASKAVESNDSCLSLIQLKIMDVVPPILDLYTRCMSVRSDSPSPDETRIVRTLEASLQQWGRLYAYVSSVRRESAIDLIDPELVYLLKEKNALPGGKDAREFLFTDSFLARRLQEARNDNDLSKSDKKLADAAANRRKKGKKFSNWSDKPRRGFHSSFGRRGGGFGAGFSDRGRWRDKEKTRGGNKRRYVLVDVSAAPHVIDPIPIPTPVASDSVARVGARLCDYADSWHSITDDRWVLSTVREGLLIDFVAPPVQKSRPPDVAMSEREEAICEAEVAALLEKGAIRLVTDGSPGFVASFFCIKKPKTVDEFRPIGNLKPLNKFIRYEHFKMEGLDSVRFLLQKGDYMIKLDLKDAYFVVGIHPSHRKYVRFQWKGRIYEFCCMAFGLAPAPRVFTKILKVVVAFLRKLGIRLVIYLDDLLFLNSSKEGVLNDFIVARDLLEKLGFVINWKKSVVTPAQIMEYLGLLIDSVKMSFALPQYKVEAVLMMCRNALGAGTVSLRCIASILGNFNWAIPTIPFAQSHYRSMQRFYIDESRKTRGDLNKRRVLSAETRADLTWWVENLSSANGKEFFPKIPDLEIESDACLEGWGAVCNGVTTRGPWTSNEASCENINELELLAALYAIQAFVGASSGLSVRIFLDNTTAVCYLNKSGGTHSVGLTATALSLASFCEERRLAVEAVHLAGKLNTVADRESRAGPDASDWMLNVDVFFGVTGVWSCDVDLFASAWNAQLDNFVSWIPQPRAMAVNAFSLNWRSVAGYAFPPFNLIFKCLDKIRREKANLVLICPVWPTQPWYPVLLELACDVPLLLPQLTNLLTSPRGRPHPLLSSRSLRLAAWNLSGKPGASRDFRNRLSSCCSQGIVRTRSQLTIQPGETGVSGVFDGTSIPFRQL